LAKKLVETTLYSLSSEAPTQPDRRQGERYVSLLRVGALIIDGRRELCLIRNVSAGGMMIRPYSAIEPGAFVCVKLTHGETMSGIAQWSDNGLVGISFGSAIDVLALLSPTGSEARPRMPRIELNCSARLHHQGESALAQVVNISQGGICLSTRTYLSLDGDVVVTLSGLAPVAGVVKWTDGDQYGIGFNRAFPVKELMRFLRDQQQDQQRRATG